MRSTGWRCGRWVAVVVAGWGLAGGTARGAMTEFSLAVTLNPVEEAHAAGVARRMESSPRGKPEAVGAPVAAAVFSPDGKFVASVTEGGNVTLWEMGSKRNCYTTATGGPAHSLCFSQDGATLYVGGDSRIGKLTVATGVLATGFMDANGKARALAISPKGDLMGIGSGYGTVEVSRFPKLNGGSGAGSTGKIGVRALWWTDAMSFTTVDDAGVWKGWVVTPGKFFVRAAKGAVDAGGLGLGAVATSGDLKVLGVVDAKGGTLTMYSYPEKKALDDAMKVGLPAGATGESLAFSPDDLTAVVAGSDGKVHFRDVSGALKKGGMAVPAGGNPLMVPAKGDDWPVLAKRISEFVNKQGEQDDRSGIQVKVTGNEAIVVGVRRVENGKVTDWGRDARFDPNVDGLMEMGPARYAIWWRKLLEPGVVHQGPTVDVYFREYDRPGTPTEVGAHVWEWIPLLVTFDGTTAKVTGGAEKSLAQPNNRK